MNCNDYRNDILLESSGELSVKRRECLQKHLSGCAECSGYAADLQKVASISEKSLNSAVPSGRVITGIMETARSRRQSRRILFPQPAFQWLAYAAALLIVVSGWQTISRNGGEESVKNQNIRQLNTIVGMIEESGEGSIDVFDDTDLDAFADRLLIMQGFGHDEFEMENLSIQDMEPVPTVFRGRSTVVPDATGCV